MDGTAYQPGPATQPGLTRRAHAAALLRLAAPLAIAQLSQVAMGVTDTAMLGTLGGDALAAGGLGTGTFLTTSFILQGVLAAVSVLVAYARGAGDEALVPDIYSSGLLLALLLCVPAFALLSCAEGLLLALGEPPGLARATGDYLHVLRWGLPGGLVGVGLMRAFLPAVGQGRLLLWVALGAALVNAALNYALIFGALGFPAYGYLGSAAATAITLWLTAAALLALLHGQPGLRRHVAPGRPRWTTLAEMLRLGLPMGATIAVETGLFLMTGLLMGLVSAAALAAHQIALTVASASFNVALALAQAANVRVGEHMGAGQPADARRSGFVAVVLGGGFMAVAACVLLAAPRPIAALFVSPDAPATRDTFAVSVTLLGIAAAFAVVDGVQVLAIGALRGLKDTRAPFLIAAFGYWAVGFPIAYVAAFWLGWGAAGLWWGLALGLGVVAVATTWRFHVQSRV